MSRLKMKSAQPVIENPAPVPGVSVTPALNPSTILTIDELAARLKVTRRVVYGLTRTRSQNPVPFFRVGKVLRFVWSEVSVWIEDQSRQAE
jgi:excisionase family DNA binding protein